MKMYFMYIKVCVHITPITKLLFHRKICALLCRHFSQKFPKHGLPHKKVNQDLTEKKQDLTKMSIIFMVLTEI